ncbi:MAG: cold shock domain-containing protein [Candidatus Heimdallarchaeota archaeon]|nr:cold shock domain-containing protein [Candidatus Heimdallarchaeota archaeon]
MKGTIKRIMYDRNFGFIQVEGEEKDIFFHRSGTTVEFGDLREGDTVEFDLEDTDRGQQAINLKTA